MTAAMVAAIVAGTSAPLAVLAVVVRQRSQALAQRELTRQRRREARRQERSQNRSRRQAEAAHASLDWLKPRPDDREATTPGAAGTMLRHIDPFVYVPRRVCRACGHSNRVAAYYCARCSSRLRR